MSEIVKRSERRHYMNTGSAGAPIWSPIGEGFTEFAESKNAIHYQRRYIHEVGKRTDVTGYASVIDYEFEVYTENPVIEKIRTITDREYTGDAARVQILSVDLFAPTETNGVYPAICRTYSVIPDRCGSGTDALCYTGSMKAAGDLTRGVFVASTGVFSK